jgi:hypothetical protein
MSALPAGTASRIFERTAQGRCLFLRSIGIEECQTGSIFSGTADIAAPAVEHRQAGQGDVVVWQRAYAVAACVPEKRIPVSDAPGPHREPMPRRIVAALRWSVPGGRESRQDAAREGPPPGDPVVSTLQSHHEFTRERGGKGSRQCRAGKTALTGGVRGDERLQPRTVGQERTASAQRDRLGRTERDDDGIAVSADEAAVPPGSPSLCGILDNGDVVRHGLADLVNRARQPVLVHRDHAPGLGPEPRQHR